MLSLKNHNPGCNTADNQICNYNGIDIMKFLCAIMVFIVHIPPFEENASVFGDHVNYMLQHCLCRLAVPFYFVSTGFFLFRKMPAYDLNVDTVKGYCFKILRLLGIWYVLLFLGGKGHLWYLGATVIAVILLSLCVYFRLKPVHICALACLLYLVGLLGQAYYGIIAPLENITIFKLLIKGYFFIFATTRNGIFMGFIFVLMGAVFSWHKINMRPRIALLGFAGSVACLLAEGLLLKKYNMPIEYNMYIFLLPAVFFLFSFVSTVKLQDRPVYKILRKAGLLLYLSHRLINEFVVLAIDGLKAYFNFNAEPLHFSIALILTLSFSIFVAWLSCKEKFKWINLTLS